MPSAFVRPKIGAPSTARRPPKHVQKQAAKGCTNVWQFCCQRCLNLMHHNQSKEHVLISGITHWTCFMGPHVGVFRWHRRIMAVCRGKVRELRCMCMCLKLPILSNCLFCPLVVPCFWLYSMTLFSHSPQGGGAIICHAIQRPHLTPQVQLTPGAQKYSMVVAIHFLEVW
jgi:hypothetical protein